VAVTVATAAIKQLVPGIKGRKTQLVAFCLSMLIALCVGRYESAVSVLSSFFNGMLIYASAVGLDHTVNYKRVSADHSRK
jgi:hypothetical protein